MAEEHFENSTKKLVMDTLFAESAKNRRSGYIRMAIYIVMSSFFLYLTISPTPEKEAIKSKVYTTQVFGNTNGTQATIAVLPIQGIITGSTIEAGTEDSGLFGKTENLVGIVRRSLQEIKKDPHVQLLVLYINSPGGTAIASDEIYHLLLDWKQETHIRVVAYCHSLAASGGYYVAQAADEIIANEGTLTGSIGVIFSSLNYTDLAARLGIEEATIKTGPFKDMGSPSRKMNPEELHIFETLLDQSFKRFLAVITTGRAGKLTQGEILRLADGRVYSGSQARELKLVDKTSTFDQMLAAETTEIEKDKKPHEVQVLIYTSGEKKFLERLLQSFNGIMPSMSISTSPRQEMLYLWH